MQHCLFASRRRSGIALLLLALLVLIAPEAPAREMYACGQEVIGHGAPTSKLRRACGEPQRVVQLVNARGAGVGERWEYERGRSLVLFTLQGGRVVRIERIGG